MEDKIINLALSENNNIVPDFLVKELQKELLLCNKYPLDIYDDVERLIRKKDSLDQSYSILLGSGLDEVIMMLFTILLSRDGNVISSSNTFNGYKHAARALGLDFKEIALKNYRIDADTVIQNIDKDTNAVIICNPHNPCGTILTVGELNEIIKSADKYDVLVILDEAYIEYVLDKNYQKNIKKLIENRNLVVLRTFSKAYGLAGLRCGYMIYQEGSLGDIKEVVQALPYRVNRLACCAAKVCMQNEKYFYDKIEEVNVMKFELYKVFDQLNLTYIRSETNFIFVRLGENINTICEILRKKYNIKVRNCVEFGFEFFVRISIGTKEEMTKFIFALRKIMEE